MPDEVGGRPVRAAGHRRLRVGAARPPSSSAVDSSCERRRGSRSPSIAADRIPAGGSVSARRAGSSRDRRQLVEVLVVVDVLVLPRAAGTGCARRGRRARAPAGCRCAPSCRPCRSAPAATSSVGEDPRVRLVVLLQHDLDVLEVVGQAGRLDLARLVDEVALGDQHEAVVARRGRRARRRRRGAGAPSRSACPCRGSSSSPITVAGTGPRDTVIAASTIDSVNALTP